MCCLQDMRAPRCMRESHLRQSALVHTSHRRAPSLILRPWYRRTPSLILRRSFSPLTDLTGKGFTLPRAFMYMCNCHYLQSAQNTRTKVQLQHPGMVDLCTVCTITNRYTGCKKIREGCQISIGYLEWGCKINLARGCQKPGKCHKIFGPPKYIVPSDRILLRYNMVPPDINCPPPPPPPCTRVSVRLSWVCGANVS